MWHTSAPKPQRRSKETEECWEVSPSFQHQQRPGQYRHSHCVQLKPMNLGITCSQWGQAHWNHPPRCLATAAAARGAHKKSVYSSATNPIFFISLVMKELPSLYFIYSILADKCHSCSFFFFFPAIKYLQWQPPVVCHSESWHLSG